jgi:hypothetical protein
VNLKEIGHLGVKIPSSGDNDQYIVVMRQGLFEGEKKKLSNVNMHLTE